MLQESSIDEPQIRDFEPTFHDDITYTVVNGATKRGKAMLIDNQGYTYNIKRRRLNVYRLAVFSPSERSSMPSYSKAKKQWPFWTEHL